MIGNIFDGDALLFLAQLPVYLISEETWIVGMTVGTSAPCWKGRNIGFQFDEAIYSLCFDWNYFLDLLRIYGIFIKLKDLFPNPLTVQSEDW